MQRAVHHVVALGAILSPDVLDHANVTVFDDHVGGIVIPFENRPQVGAGGIAGHRGGIVGCARKQDRRSLGPLRDQDDGVQLDAVAHGDHDVAPGVVPTAGVGFEMGRDLAG